MQGVSKQTKRTGKGGGRNRLGRAKQARQAWMNRSCGHPLRHVPRWNGTSVCGPFVLPCMATRRKCSGERSCETEGGCYSSFRCLWSPWLGTQQPVTGEHSAQNFGHVTLLQHVQSGPKVSKSTERIIEVFHPKYMKSSLWTDVWATLYMAALVTQLPPAHWHMIGPQLAHVSLCPVEQCSDTF
jgi:hypothetical protein